MQWEKKITDDLLSKETRKRKADKKLLKEIIERERERSLLFPRQKWKECRFTPCTDGKQIRELLEADLGTDKRGKQGVNIRVKLVGTGSQNV